MSARFTNEEQDQNKQAAEEKLLQAAAEAIARDGYTKANINRISLAAGFAKGTVYNYFESKQALMEILLQKAAEDHLKTLRVQVLSVQGAPERLRTFFVSGFAYVEEHLAPMRCVLHTLYGPYPVFRITTWQVYQPMFRFVTEDILLPGVQAGVFRSAALETTSQIVMTFYLGSASQLDEQGKTYLDAGQVADFALRAVMKNIQEDNES